MTARIEQPYLLVLFSLLFHVDAEGRRWVHPLWAKDLARHADYIGRLTYAAPATREPPLYVAKGGVVLTASMALAYLDRARKSTHACMHEARRRLIIDAFPGLAHPQAAGSTS